MVKAKVYLMKRGTRDNVSDLFVNGKNDAIKKLVQSGDLIPIDAEAHVDSCGTFSHATFTTTIDKL